jgi:uncharacterized membrane protein YqjE
MFKLRGRSMIEKVPKLFLQMIRNRLELFSLELQEEKLFLGRQLMLTLIGVVLGLMGLFALSILIVFIVPYEHRIVVASVFVGMYLITAAVALIIATRLAKRHTPFESTLAALNKDIYNT